ncbi:tRNase Z TRZ3, mitochondrial-like [Nymphaea colorata]|nr:tRNase Z TRZ3, mitochondrial-like [Nymphaea colorata]
MSRMPPVSGLRLFFSTSPLLIPKPKTPLIPLRPFPPPRFTVLCASFGKKTQFPRRFSTLRNPKTREKPPQMEEKEKEGVGFNKRRAEGKDKGQPKNLQLKSRKLNPVNTICYVQILGTGMDTQDTSPSVLLFFDKQRFFFNAGEGLQRFCTEHKIKLSKIDHIFLTRVCSETAGGLPGLLLTMAGIGDDGMSVNMWGPSDLKYLVDAMRTFIPNAATVHTHSFGPAPGSISGLLKDPIILVNDEVVKISAIILCPALSGTNESIDQVDNGSDVTGFDFERNLDDFSKYPSLSPPGSPKKASLATKPGDLAVVYMCELPEIKGKFDPAKAMALGLKPGPKYRELQLGNTVMSDRKNIMVRPSDVLGPSIPGPVVILVDCPTLSHVHGLVSVPSLKKYYVDSTDPDWGSSKPVNCVIHLGPASVTSTESYRKWMSRFGGAQHIMAGHEMKNVEIPILKASARIASRLNYVCPQLFPTNGFWTVGNIDSCPMDSISSSKEVLQCIPSENLLKFHLRPYANLGLDKSGIPPSPKPSYFINELLSEIPEIEDASKVVRKFWECPTEKAGNNSFPVEEPWISEASVEEVQYQKGNENMSFEDVSQIPASLENISREDMEIVLLGTGSSQPSKYRNVSSIYINLFARGSLLLDCGEGTLGQLKRRFGMKGADDAIKSLKCIWISHIHADHHTGLARVLALRSQLLRHEPHEPLLVIGPRQLKRFLDAYSMLEDLDMQFLDCRQTLEISKDVSKKSLETVSTHDILQQGNGSRENGIAGSGSLTMADGGNPLQTLEGTLFVKSKMQSYWKKSGFQGDAVVDTAGLEKLRSLLEDSGLEALISVPVVHCPQAFGLVLKAASRINSTGKTIPGWKLVYSGDTRPCQALIDASRGATVLIHEATFEDSLLEEAIARNHSTTKEAVQVGESAGVYRVILTHFSQRYPKIPVVDETHMNTCIGFDMMSVNVADLPVLPKVMPFLKLLFRNEMVADETDESLTAESY